MFNGNFPFRYVDITRGSYPIKSHKNPIKIPLNHHFPMGLNHRHNGPCSVPFGFSQRRSDGVNLDVLLQRG